MSTRNDLKALFESRYQLSHLTGRSADEFVKNITSRLSVRDGASEGFTDESRQRDLAIKFHWGHNHDFGSGFSLPGRMVDRHINLIADFVDHFGLPRNLTGCRVLDIGVWTGGTSLVLAAMGAEVVAVEEVVKYAEVVNYLANSFGIESRLRCYPSTLFRLLPRFADEFDYVIYPGVIYHVTDPLLSLRMVFTALKNGGKTFLETYGCDSTDVICRYEGPSCIHSGTQADCNRAGWNYFAPSPPCLQAWCRDAGFQEVQIGPYHEGRIQGVAARTQFVDLCRAGLSQVDCR